MKCFESQTQCFAIAKIVAIVLNVLFDLLVMLFLLSMKPKQERVSEFDLNAKAFFDLQMISIYAGMLEWKNNLFLKAYKWSACQEKKQSYAINTATRTTITRKIKIMLLKHFDFSITKD